MKHATTPAPNAVPVRVGTLGIGYPKLPTNIHPYTAYQAEVDLETLSWITERELELVDIGGEDGPAVWEIFDWKTGGSVLPAPVATRWDAVDDAARELL
jgi:hypothetical protein